MDCRTIARLIENYLVDDLTPTTRSEFDAHLAVCSTCRVLVHDFVHLDAFLCEMPREAMIPQLTARIRGQVRAHALRGRIGHAMPVAIATLFSALMFIWLATETWLALQDRALWEFVTWFISMPDILWHYPGEVLAGFADFAPISGLIFTLGSAFSSWWLAKRLIDELRSPLVLPMEKRRAVH
jgi:putative zinc finger protein